MSNKNYYAIYLNKTDEIIATGSSKECAKTLGISLASFYSLVSKNNRGIQKKYSIYTEPLDETSAE